MNLLSKVFGGRPAEAVVTHAIADAVRVLPGVSAHTLAYHHVQTGGGSVDGVVDVADTETFVEVLRTVSGVLISVLEHEAEPVVLHLSARTPGGAAVLPGDLGLTQPPTCREVTARLPRS